MVKYYSDLFGEKLGFKGLRLKELTEQPNKNESFEEY
jgi:hypothetical protein